LHGNSSDTLRAWHKAVTMTELAGLDAWKLWERQEKL
jgi:hypothetical protein